MREDITSFCPDNGNIYPFLIEMAGISYCDGSYRIKRENSPIYVFEYVLGGEGTVKSDGSKFHPVKGDIYILHRGSNHEYFSSPENPWTKIWINARGALIDSLLDVYGLRNVSHIRDVNLGEYFHRILSIARMKHLDMKLIFEKCSVVFYKMLIEIASQLDSVSGIAEDEACKVKNYIDMHLKEKINIKDLSKVIYKSPSQTIRIFRNKYGDTPYDYLLNKRIDTASMLLANSVLNIKEIADYLGFVDQHYFCNCFKRKIGKSPKEFRRSIIGN